MPANAVAPGRNGFAVKPAAPEMHMMVRPGQCRSAAPSAGRLRLRSTAMPSSRAAIG